MNTAAKVREAKEKNPENFCSDPRCLWRTVTRDGIKPCPKHPVSDQWIKDRESVPWCKKCGDRPAVPPYEDLLCDQCNSQVYRLFLTDDEADSE